MTENHHFTLKNKEYPITLDGRVYNDYLQRAILHSLAVSDKVNAWLAHNEITSYMEWPFKHHINDSGITIGYEKPSWTFENELDALQFKLVFGDEFYYEIYDAE